MSQPINSRSCPINIPKPRNRTSSHSSTEYSSVGESPQERTIRKCDRYARRSHALQETSHSWNSSSSFGGRRDSKEMPAFGDQGRAMTLPEEDGWRWESSPLNPSELLPGMVFCVREEMTETTSDGRARSRSREMTITSPESPSLESPLTRRRNSTSSLPYNPRSPDSDQGGRLSREDSFTNFQLEIPASRIPKPVASRRPLQIPMPLLPALPSRRPNHASLEGRRGSLGTQLRTIREDEDLITCL